MTYNETLQFLYTQLPMFQRVGAPAFKKDLTNTIELCRVAGDPQKQFKSIHIAGTNGKGSTSHIVAGVFQEAGYKVGLYTSPHYKDFRERIKINGNYIPESFVVLFVQRYIIDIQRIKPSFFEITVVMAFSYFAEQKVDIAVIEVGMGGRFDSTNVVLPELSVITNIGLDHTQFLGDTLDKIAFEKAGIIKPGIPVVIGEQLPLTRPVFLKAVEERSCPIYFADELMKVELLDKSLSGMRVSVTRQNAEAFIFDTDLFGAYQLKNLRTALMTIDQIADDWGIEQDDITRALAHIRSLTNFIGRCQVLQENPLTIVDSGHNADGVREILNVINELSFKQLHFVIGAVNDKDLSGMLSQLPTNATYYFCKPNIPRGLDADIIRAQAAEFDLKGNAYPSVADAYKATLAAADADDLVFVGGSIFVVAEVL